MSMGDRDSTHGVSPAVLIAVGQVVVSAGELEAAAQRIALALDRDMAGKTIRPTVEAIRAATRSGLAAYCTCGSAEILLWCEELLSAMRERNARLHSAFVRRVIDEGFETVQLDRKDRADLPVTEAVFQQLHGRLRDLAVKGFELERRLLPEMAPGIHFQLRTGGIVVYYQDGWPMRRPSEEDVDSWYQQARAYWDDPHRSGPPPVMRGYGQ